MNSVFRKLILPIIASLMVDYAYLKLVMWLFSVHTPFWVLTALPFTISFTLNFLFIDWLLLRKKLGWKYVCANEIIVIALLVLLL